MDKEVQKKKNFPPYTLGMSFPISLASIQSVTVTKCILGNFGKSDENSLSWAAICLLCQTINLNDSPSGQGLKMHQLDINNLVRKVMRRGEELRRMEGEKK